MIIKRTIKFSIRNYRNAGYRIRMRVSYDGNRLDFQTGLVIQKENWDDRQQRIMSLNSNTTVTNEFNEHLSQMSACMVTVFREFELRQVIPSPKELRNAFHAKTYPQLLTTEESFKKDSTINVHQVDINKPKKKKNDFWKCFDEFVKVNGKLNDWTPETYEKFAALRNHLQDFNKKLNFEDFNEDGIADFINYMGKKGYEE